MYTVGGEDDGKQTAWEPLLCGFVKHAVISISDDVFYTSIEQVLLGWIEGSFR